MIQGTFYSIKEMAQRLEIDWQTLLQWKYQYLFHLPSYRQENQLKYPAETEILFHFIKEAKSAQIHDDVIQLWVDKQAEKCHCDGINDLTGALNALIQELDSELNQLYCEWESARIERQERLYSLLENATWEELKQLQKAFPNQITFEEHTGDRITSRRPIVSFF